MRKPITVVGMSDLHGLLPKEMPSGDVLCICGDVVPLDVQSDTIESIAWLCTKFFPWIESLPYKKVFMVWGNHDFIGQELTTDKHGQHRKPKRVLKKLMAPAKLTLLEDTETIYEGYRFYGSPWCPDLSNWAFYADSRALDRNFSKIPANTDVLITHCAPRIGMFGTTIQGWNAMRDFGCEELATWVKERAPKLHIFGHIHTGQHKRETIDGTTFANVSIKDENYEHTYEPQIFHLT